MFAPVDQHATTISLGALHDAAVVRAGALHRIGVRPGDHVILQGPADVTSTETLVALWLLGTVVVPLTATATEDEVAHAVQ